MGLPPEECHWRKETLTKLGNSQKHSLLLTASNLLPVSHRGIEVGRPPQFLLAGLGRNVNEDRSSHLLTISGRGTEVVEGRSSQLLPAGIGTDLKEAGSSDLLHVSGHGTEVVQCRSSQSLPASHGTQVLGGTEALMGSEPEAEAQTEGDAIAEEAQVRGDSDIRPDSSTPSQPKKEKKDWEPKTLRLFAVLQHPRGGSKYLKDPVTEFRKLQQYQKEWEEWKYGSSNVLVPEEVVRIRDATMLIQRLWRHARTWRQKVKEKEAQRNCKLHLAYMQNRLALGLLPGPHTSAPKEGINVKNVCKLHLAYIENRLALGLSPSSPSPSPQEGSM